MLTRLLPSPAAHAALRRWRSGARAAAAIVDADVAAAWLSAFWVAAQGSKDIASAKFGAPHLRGLFSVS